MMSNSAIYPPEFASSEAELETVITTDNQENEEDQLKARKLTKIHSECSRMFDSIRQLYGEFFKKFLHDFCKANKKWSWYQEKNSEMDKEFACQLLNLDINRSSFKDPVNIDKLKNLFAWSNTRRMNGKQSHKTLDEKSTQFKNFIDNNKMEETYLLLLIFFLSNGYNICKQHKLFSNSTNDGQSSGSNSNNSERKPMLFSGKEEKEVKVKFFSDLVKWTLKQKTKKGGQRRIFQEAKGMQKSEVYDKLKMLFVNSDAQFNIADINFIQQYFENEGGLFELIENFKSENSVSHERLKSTYEAYLALYNGKHIHSNRNMFSKKLSNNNNINNFNNMNNRNHYSSDNGNNTINNMGSGRHIGRYGNIGSKDSNGGNGSVNDMTMLSGSDIDSVMNKMTRMSSMNGMNSMNSMNTKTRRMGKTSHRQFTDVSSRQCPHPKRRKRSICSERRHNNNNNNNMNGLKKVHRVFNRINIKKMERNDRYDEECKGKIYFFEDGSIELIEIYCSIDDFFEFSDCTNSAITDFETHKQQNEKQKEKKIRTDLPNLPHLTDFSFENQVHSQVQSQIQNVDTFPTTRMTSMAPMTAPTATRVTARTPRTARIAPATATTRVRRHRDVREDPVEMDSAILHSSDSNDGMTSMNDDTTTNGNTMSSHSINSAGSFSGSFKIESMNGNLSGINNLNDINNINSSKNIGMAEDGLTICSAFNYKNIPIFDTVDSKSLISNFNGGNKSSFGNGINNGLTGDFSSSNIADLMSLTQDQIARNSKNGVFIDSGAPVTGHETIMRETPSLQPVGNLIMFPQSRVESNSALNRMNGVVNQLNDRIKINQLQTASPPPMNLKMANSNSNSSNSNLNANVDYLFGANEMKNLNVENENNVDNVNDHVHSLNNVNVNSLNDPRLRSNSAMVDFSSTMASLGGSGTGNMIFNPGMNRNSNANGNVHGNVHGNVNVNGRCNLNNNGNVNCDNSRSYVNSVSGVNNSNMFNNMNPIGECEYGLHYNTNVNSNVNKSRNGRNDCLINSPWLNSNHNGRNNNGMNNVGRQNDSNINTNGFGYLGC